MKDDDRWEALFRDVPTAFWLDPELWGPRPRYDNVRNFNGMPVLYGTHPIRSNLIWSEDS